MPPFEHHRQSLLADLHDCIRPHARSPRVYVSGVRSGVPRLVPSLHPVLSGVAGQALAFFLQPDGSECNQRRQMCFHTEDDEYEWYGQRRRGVGDDGTSEFVGSGGVLSGWTSPVERAQSGVWTDRVLVRLSESGLPRNERVRRRAAVNARRGDREVPERSYRIRTVFSPW